MKKSKVLGATLCSAALAMGMAMPAFAAGPGDVDTQVNSVTGSNGGDVSTAVDVYYNATQIKATVPMKFAIGIKPGDEQPIVGPSTGAYQIANESTDATLYVTSIKAAATDATKWKLNSVSSTKPTDCNADVQLTLAANGSTVNLTSATAQTPGSGFQVAKGNKLSIDVSGKSTTKDGLSLTAGAYTSGAFSITYTIGTSAS